MAISKTRKPVEAAAPPPLAREGTVHVIDDDRELREYIRWLLERAGWQVRTYADARAFLTAYADDGAACVVTDLYMPEMSGLELQAELRRRGVGLPLIMMSAQGAVGSAVQAMLDGAVDFLEKPFDPQRLLERVAGALAVNLESRRGATERASVAARLKRLTPRQRAVLDRVIAGQPSKIIAAELGLSPRTVDVHRFRLMHILGAESLPDLFRLVLLVNDGR
ncbi:MAG: response regulator [bacterium]